MESMEGIKSKTIIWLTNHGATHIYNYVNYNEKYGGVMFLYKNIGYNVSFEYNRIHHWIHNDLVNTDTCVNFNSREEMGIWIRKVFE